MNQSQEIQEAMKERPSALEPWKNRKHVRVRQRANDMVVAGTLKQQVHMGLFIPQAFFFQFIDQVPFDGPTN